MNGILHVLEIWLSVWNSIMKFYFNNNVLMKFYDVMIIKGNFKNSIQKWD